MAVVRRQYWAAIAEGNEDEMRRLEEIGRAATLAGRVRAPKPGASAFGATGRDLQRRKVLELRKAMCGVAEGKDKEESAVAVGKHLSMIGADVATCLSVARSALKAHSEQERTRQAERAKALLEFRSGEGQEQLRRLRQAVPGLPCDAGLVPVPCSTGLCFELLLAERDLVAQTVSWLYNTKATNLTADMRTFWERTHHALMEGECGPIVKKDDGQSRCRLAGRCLCGLDGAKLQSLKNAFLRAMKRIFHKDSAHRSALLTGEILVHLTGRPKEGGSEAYLDMEEPTKSVLLQVGIMYLKPYQPTFQVLELEDGPIRSELPERVMVKAH